MTFTLKKKNLLSQHETQPFILISKQYLLEKYVYDTSGHKLLYLGNIVSKCESYDWHFVDNV